MLLAVLARGVSVSEAAETLGWSEREVRAELVSASRKRGARSVLEALICAVRRGDIRRPVVG
jgi:DNA-binding NarL/FixJ family response regulator